MIINSFNTGIQYYYHIIISLFTYDLLNLLDINNNPSLILFILQIISLFFNNEEMKDNSIIYTVIYIPKLFPFFAISNNDIRSISSKYNIIIIFNLFI